MHWYNQTKQFPCMNKIQYPTRLMEWTKTEQCRSGPMPPSRSIPMPEQYPMPHFISFHSFSLLRSQRCSSHRKVASWSIPRVAHGLFGLWCHFQRVLPHIVGCCWLLYFYFLDFPQLLAFFLELAFYFHFFLQFPADF